MGHPLGDFISVSDAPAVPRTRCFPSWLIQRHIRPSCLLPCTIAHDPWRPRHCRTVLFGSTSANPHWDAVQAVTELKGFAAWGSLLKNKMWPSQGSFIYFQQGKQIRKLRPKLCLWEERFCHCLDTLFSQ